LVRAEARKTAVKSAGTSARISARAEAAAAADGDRPAAIADSEWALALPAVLACCCCCCWRSAAARRVAADKTTAPIATAGSTSPSNGSDQVGTVLCARKG
jgi:hypothetical protein